MQMRPVGRVAIAGLTSAELQSEMAALLSAKLFSQRTPDGRENLIVVKPGDITATIDRKLAALRCHVSQLPDPEPLLAGVRARLGRLAEAAGYPPGTLVESFTIARDN